MSTAPDADTNPATPAPVTLGAAGVEQALPELRAELSASLARLEAYAARARTAATRRAYRSDWQHFSNWCERYGAQALPATPETIGLYLGDIAPRYKLATIERRLACISSVHKEHGLESPASVSRGPLRNIWRGLVREKTRRQSKAAALMAKDLVRLVEALPRDASGSLTLPSLRDRAMLLVGWAGALRRSELVALRLEDVRIIDGEGLQLYIRSSKTDQEGLGLTKGIPYGSRSETCPVVALRTWLRASGVTGGPLFRRFYRGGRVGEKALTAQYVSLRLKEHAARVGLDPDHFSAHSLRAGFITQAVRSGKSERRVKEHSGHKSWDVFNAYVREASAFHDNPAKDIGL